jgi:predicted methyltransferase
MFRVFRRGPGPHALALAMAGVKMGERLLSLGGGTPGMFAALASKVGLTGRAAAIVPTEDAAAALRDAAAREGVLVDVEVQPRSPFTADAASFDVAVIDSTGGYLGSLAPEARVGVLRDLRRLLRPGGRALVVERAPRGGLGALVGGAGGPRRLGPDGLVAALQAEGFRPARVLAERDGYLFVEGLTTSSVDSRQSEV